MSNKLIFNVLFLSSNLIIFIVQLSGENRLSARALQDSETVIEELNQTFKKQYDLLRLASRNISSCDDGDIRVKLDTLDRLIAAHEDDAEYEDIEGGNETELANSAALGYEYAESFEEYGDSSPAGIPALEELLTTPEFEQRQDCIATAAALDRYSLEDHIHSIVQNYNDKNALNDSPSLEVDVTEIDGASMDETNYSIISGMSFISSEKSEEGAENDSLE